MFISTSATHHTGIFRLSFNHMQGLTSMPTGCPRFSTGGTSGEISKIITMFSIIIKCNVFTLMSDMEETFIVATINLPFFRAECLTFGFGVF